MAATVPPALEQRLAALVPRVRALRVARGVSRCLFATVGSAVLALVLDALVGLPETARGLLVAVWVTALGVLVWQFVLKPWQAEIPLSEVAAELSQRLPELANRLQAVIAPANGTSEAVRAALREDTLRRAKAVDFERAVPAHPTLLALCWALLALLAFLMLTGLLPNSAERLRRVALPWARPPAAPLRVVVTSGEPVVRRGAAVTLSAFAERTESRPGAVAHRATALFRDAPEAPERAVAMAADDAGAFHVTRACVPHDFEYRVLIGGAASEWFKVTALDPVDLAPNTRIEVAPPGYVKAHPRVLSALTDFDTPDASRLTARLAFTQPAASALFEWHAHGATKMDPVPVALAPDRLSGASSLVLRTSGELKLVLLREVDGKKLRTVLTANVHVAPDQAPWFETLTGVGTRPRSVRPGGRVPIAVVACDDFCVSDARLEYTLELPDSRTHVLPIPLTGAGTSRATGRLDFDPSAVAPLGGTVRFRVRVTDNRASEDPKLMPQETLYPANGWSELTLSASAPPLEEQDARNQRDAFRAAAEAARGSVREAAEAVAVVRAESPATGALSVDQAVRVNVARERARLAAASLSALARDAALVPEFRPLAAGAGALVARELRGAEEALARAEAEGSSRADGLTTASADLSAADAKLGTLLAQNDALARTRLDRARLGALADDQAALAGAKQSASEFGGRQRELIARLKELVADSEPLRLALEGGRSEEARRFASDLAELAEATRGLDAASQRTIADARAALVARFAADQEEQTRRAERLLAATETAARLVGVGPPRANEFRKVTELAATGRTVEALTELEQQTQALERLAREFDAWAEACADPKKGAKLLALWQGDLLTRFRAATRGIGFDRLPADARAALRAEQHALGDAVGRLHLPPDPSVRSARDGAARHCGRAVQTMSSDGRSADTAMRLAVEALERVADLMPPAGERLYKARSDFDKLRAEQEALANATDQALRGFEGQPAVPPPTAKKLAALADRQCRLSEQAAALDLPGMGARQGRLAAALALAGADLRGAAPFDVQASQLLARREYERLKLELEGATPPDVRCEELRRKLGALAVVLDAHGPDLTAKQLEPAVPVVQETLRLLPAGAPEAAVLLNDARLALQAAELALRDGSKPGAARLRVRGAAEALEKLAARLNGSEPDLARVQRLAGYRRAAAVRAKELADAKAPFSAPASDEALRQLARECEELAHTRVGPAGQAARKRVLDQYARIGGRREPDRLASDQRALAEALDELAAKMADVAELATAPPPEPPAAAEAAAYLPSRPFADRCRELIQYQRAQHERLTDLPRALADRLRPAPANTFAALETRQRALAADFAAFGPDAEPAARAARAAADFLRTGAAPEAKEQAETALRFADGLAKAGAGKPWGARAVELAARQGARLGDIAQLVGASGAAVLQQMARAGELAGRAATLADTLERAVTLRDPQDPTRAALAGAAGLVRAAAQKLLEAGQRVAESDARRAAILRAEAIERAREAHERVSETVLPVPLTNPVLGHALRVAERSARAALEASPDPRASAADAATALRAAAQHVGAVK
ncbi:hypothetical protein R5W24_005706 [Gemmata sp. JC717]|uniref:hypothetical protein n=1 Tax=Gemmata algarum TaxID=2975278 RepID=UPI0021BB0F69|nr:hypothetical protein [Gemmata algarum]MDY3556540.1 hypothetical protein [Gemmata algarum]